MAGKGTPATIAAERAGIDFAVHEYAHDPAAPACWPEAAERLGQNPERVLKTLVVSVDGRLVVSCIPVGAQLDLKAVAAAAGGRKAAMAERAEAERATGYVAGGISSGTRPSSSARAAAASSWSSVPTT